MLEQDVDYRRSVETWRITPEMLTTAKEAEMAASRENIRSLEELLKLCDAESRGEAVDPRLKEEVFRIRCEKVRCWTYLRDVYNELARAADARNYICRNAERREESSRVMTHIDTYYKNALDIGRANNEAESLMRLLERQDRPLTEFGM